jgi:hypothetical protein
MNTVYLRRGVAISATGVAMLVVYIVIQQLVRVATGQVTAADIERLARGPVFSGVNAVLVMGISFLVAAGLVVAVERRELV